MVLGIGSAVAEFDRDFIGAEAAQKDGAGDLEAIAGVELGNLAVTQRGADADFAPEAVQTLALGSQGESGLALVGHQFPVIGGGWRVELLAVLVDHPAAGEEACGHLDGGLHHGDPGDRVAPAGTIVEKGRDVVLQQFVEGGRLDLVSVFVVVIFLAPADGESAVRRITFAPPAIENGGIEDAVHGRLHAGGAAGFDAAAGGIKPDIDALHQIAGDAHVVVFEEEKPAPDAGTFGEFHHLADEVLAVLVGRVGFAGIDELDRALGMVDEGFQPVRVAQ